MNIEVMKAGLAGIADRHRVARARAADVFTVEELTRIEHAAHAHGLQQMENHLEAGVDEDTAASRAFAAASRHEDELKRIALAHAHPSATYADLSCAQCAALTKHVLTVDHAGETVAHCRCGRFRKFAAGAAVED